MCMYKIRIFVQSFAATTSNTLIQQNLFKRSLMEVVLDHAVLMTNNR